MPRSATELWRYIAAGLTGGAAGAMFMLAGAPLALAAVAAAAGYWGARRLFLPQPARMPLSPDSSPEKILMAVRAKIRRLEELEETARNTRAHPKIENIRLLAQQILKNLEQHPEDIPPARGFLNYYFETALKIIEKYVEFSAFRDPPDFVRQTMARTETTLDLVVRAFSRELAHLAENDVIDLEAELDVLQKMVQMDGMSEDLHAK